MNNDEPKYGWYSPKMAELVGTVRYTTPIPGQEVICTLVNHSPILHNSNWDDIVLVGEVVRCTRLVQGGRLSELFRSWEPEDGWDEGECS